MTDKKLAKEYVDKLCEKKVNNEDYDKDGWILFRSEDISEAFLAGLNAGRPKWHDLRKKPNDLPKKGGEYWCYMLCDGGNYIYRAVVFQGNVFNHFYNAKIIGWCETPKFEE